MEGDSSRYKRRRSPSSSSSSSSGESDPEEGLSPAPKYHRSTPSSSLPYTCTLPPTCSQPDTVSSYATEAELERHQDAFHRWICRTPIRNKTRPTGDAIVPESFVSKRGGFNGEVWKECGKVLPDERLLHLHQLETHDPLERARQARGEKIFQCFVPRPSCKKTFMNPTRRRRHLIEKHHYPEQYFFSITNHGINQIVRDDGLAMSLIRPKRETPKTFERHAPSQPPEIEGEHIHSPIGSPLASAPTEVVANPPDVDMDGLLESMQSSLMFVPPGLRRKQAARAKE